MEAPSCGIETEEFCSPGCRLASSISLVASKGTIFIAVSGCHFSVALLHAFVNLEFNLNYGVSGTELLRMRRGFDCYAALANARLVI